MPAASRHSRGPQAARRLPPKVTVAKPAKRLVADQDEYVGRFVAVDAIEVRARVSGYLDAIHFKDGQLVKKGDLLFTIDRRPFEASLAQAQANLAQARANLAYAEADLERGQGLVRGSTITQQTFDQRTQAKRVAEAVGQGARKRPCARPRSISSSPSCARRSRDASATGASPPATSSRAARPAPRRCSPPSRRSIPIRFEFTMDETSYLRYMRLAGASRRRANRGINVPVELKLIDEPKFSPRGQDGLRRQRHRPRLRHHPRAAPSSPTPTAR